MHENQAGTTGPIGAAQIDLGQAAGPAPVRRRRASSAPPKARFFSSWRIVAALALGVVTLLGGLFLAAGIADPESWFGEVSPLAWVHDARAASLLDQPRQTVPDLDRAEQESWTALRQAPADDVAWLNLAQVDRLRHGRLTASGVKWLGRSYDVAPFGPDTSIWRIRFALNNWRQLPPDLRQEVVAEFKAEWSHEYLDNAQQELQAMSPDVADPSGRLALSMLLAMSPKPN